MSATRWRSVDQHLGARFGIVSSWWRARMKPSRRLAIYASCSKRKTCCFPMIENDSAANSADHRLLMLIQAKVAVMFVLVAFSLMMGIPDATAGSQLPDPIKAGVAEKLFRLDCGRSLA